MQCLPQILQICISFRWRLYSFLFSNTSEAKWLLLALKDSGSSRRHFESLCRRWQRKVESLPLSDLPIFQALWDQNFWGEKEIHLLWIKIINCPSGRLHNSANIFSDVKYHYDCDSYVNRRHESTRKIEGDDVSREDFIPILVPLIKAYSLLGPCIYKQVRACWGCEG